MKVKPFVFLNTTQFLGVFNDNFFKLLLIFALINLQGIRHSGVILSFAGAIFVLPFLLFSIPAGTLADRISKRTIILIIKAIEVAAALLGVISFKAENPFGLYSALFILALSGAIFGPAKYGIVPELVCKSELSKANGYLSSCTYLAIIIGTSAAGPLVNYLDQNFYYASYICLIFALVGMIIALKIPKTPPAGSTKKIPIFFFREVSLTLKEASKIPHLVIAILCSSYFLFIGGFTQLNIIPYAVYCMQLTDIQGSYLFLVTALGIGFGSLLAGVISGKSVKLKLSPVGALGMGLCSIYLAVCEFGLIPALIDLFLLGTFSGLYLIPLDSYIQAASPVDKRGQNVAVNNLFGFIQVLFASLLLYILGVVLDFSSNVGFMIIGIITLLVSCLLFIFLSKTRVI